MYTEASVCALYALFKTAQGKLNSKARLTPNAVCLKCESIHFKLLRKYRLVLRSLGHGQAMIKEISDTSCLVKEERL